MQVKAGMRLKPALYGVGLMGGVIVDDEMEVEIGRGVVIDQLQETQELAVAPLDCSDGTRPR